MADMIQLNLLLEVQVSSTSLLHSAQCLQLLEHVVFQLRVYNLAPSMQVVGCVTLGCFGLVSYVQIQSS